MLPPTGNKGHDAATPTISGQQGKNIPFNNKKTFLQTQWKPSPYPQTSFLGSWSCGCFL
jgi:hypothetical protein